MAAFSTADLPDLSGRTVIVTGASSGIGRTTATAFANAGARVVLAVRDPARGRAVASSIAAVAATEPASAEPAVRELDLARLDSIRAFASAWRGDIDLLINNAGVMVPPLSRTADGFELANLLFTTELQRRLTEVGSPVRATAAHPGYAATNLGFHSDSRLLAFAIYQGNRHVAQDAPSVAGPSRPGVASTVICG